jgi:hypothetical protein
MLSEAGARGTPGLARRIEPAPLGAHRGMPNKLNKK